MYSFCEICKRNYASSFNLKRHMETVHLEFEKTEQPKDTETDSEDEDEGDSEKSKNSENEESSETSDESDSDNYSFNEVRAILRYTLKSSES